MKVVSLFIALLLCSANIQADTILVLGDSLSRPYNIDRSQGWVKQLARELHPDHKLVNGSIGGTTSGRALARLPKLLETHQPDWVIIELGGNDGLRGHPLKVLRANIENIISLSQAAGAKPIIFGIRVPPNYGNRYSNSFRELFQEIANEYDLPYLDFLVASVFLNPSMIQDDGIHPKAEAQPLIKEHVSQFLLPLLAGSEQ